ncbi:hypothetical protein C7H85_17035 [Zobellella endophytica]|uniref:Type 4 fimbrial biogenesis protein PilX N-terminal domain-containing protein n=1 Tax=Zobellella endophytica TaxID=2116700 RepID=A0A2P7QXK2_9GAMM|nr:PilX N-terminal domain-containing pilus assembly protein [Zobellella endophytica]PSJ42684.1 hypothetical protein C7H85_17035 [Zobellella endophytica]
MMGTDNKGFTTLTVTLVLVAILAAVSAFIGKVLISDRRITSNEIEYRMAFAAAEQGIADAIAALNVDVTTPAVSGSVTTSQGVATYSVAMTIGSTVSNVVDIISTAALNESVVSVTTQVAERNILNPGAGSGPSAPLLVGGATTGISGNMTVVANPNGGGPGVAVSVWSGDDITGSGSMQTCHLGDYDPDSGNCNATISEKQGGTVLFDSDVVDNDPDFPTDMLEYMFGYSADEWDKIEAMATGIVANCSDVIPPGFFIVDGGGECDLKDVGSSPTAPAIILVKDANLKANGGDKFYGLVFSFDSNLGDAAVYNISLNGGAQVFGAIATNHGGDNLNGTFDVVYDSQVICAFSDCDASGGGGGGSSTLTIRTIPGSWKDWN